MSEQALDLRTTWATLRRHRVTLAAAALVGAAAGAGLVAVRPPQFASVSMVLLPPTHSTDSQKTTRDTDTQVRIAGSDVVLGPAGKAVHPRISAARLAQQLQITATTADVIRIEASAETADRAEALARAVSKAELTYFRDASRSLGDLQQAGLIRRVKALQASLATVNTEVAATTTRKNSEAPQSVAGKADAAALAQLTAQQASLVLQIDQVKGQAAGSDPGDDVTLIQEASPAERPGMVERFVLFGLLGLAGLTLLVAVLLSVFGRRDRRLRMRDEIADALGSAVIGSIHSQVPQTVSGWSSLLSSYTPATVDAWALRQALRHLVAGEAGLGILRGDQRDDRRDDRADPEVHHPVSITVVCLSDDSRALAMGPQLASYAASAGVLTQLVAAQGHASSAALWGACARENRDEEVRPDLWVATRSPRDREADLTVVLAVVDRRKPELFDLPETSVTILAVSAGSATAEDLARTAVTADDANCRIAGIVVADPDDLDRTTGRLLQTERSQEAHLPARLTGVSAGAGPRSSGSNVSGLRRSSR